MKNHHNQVQISQKPGPHIPTGAELHDGQVAFLHRLSDLPMGRHHRSKKRDMFGIWRLQKLSRSTPDILEAIFDDLGLVLDLGLDGAGDI